MARLMVCRRSRGDGFAEIIKWKLSKGPATNSEIAEKFKLTAKEAHRKMRDLVGVRKSYEITASDWFINSNGNEDRIYTLVRLQMGKSQAKAGLISDVRISKEGDKYRNEGSRKNHIKQAKERSRLITSGKYNQEAELMLCTN